MPSVQSNNAPFLLFHLPKHTLLFFVATCFTTSMTSILIIFIHHVHIGFGARISALANI